MSFSFENFVTKLWCTLPKCWHYTHYTENEIHHIFYIWFIWRKFDIFRFKHSRKSKVNYTVWS